MGGTRSSQADFAACTFLSSLVFQVVSGPRSKACVLKRSVSFCIIHPITARFSLSSISCFVLGGLEDSCHSSKRSPMQMARLFPNQTAWFGIHGFINEVDNSGLSAAQSSSGRRALFGLEVISRSEGYTGWFIHWARRYSAHLHAPVPLIYGNHRCGVGTMAHGVFQSIDPLTEVSALHTLYT